MFVYIFILLSYLLGSIPFGLILIKFFLKKDIRNIGSGNIGATNVLRSGNKLIAFLTLLLDALKGVVAIIITSNYTDNINIIYLCALASLIGHIFPIWLKFKGGKGVATGLAVIFILDPKIGSIGVIVWLLTFVFFRISSISAIIAFISLPISSFIFNDSKSTILYLIIAVIVILNHRENIKRLLKAEEKRI